MRGGAEFDGVVVGAGPNGLVCAAYLARAGLRMAVVERQSRAGGGATTEQLTLPGFRHNVHSNFHAIGAGPVVRDLGLEHHGLRYIYPDVQHAFIFRDESALCLHADAQRTASSIARFSVRDSDRYLELHRTLGRQLAPFLRGLQFSPPLTDAQLAERVDGPLGAEYMAYRELSLYEAIDRNFEHDKVRAAFKLHCHASAYEEGPRLGHVFLRIVARSGWSGLPVGGAESLSRALRAVIEEHGGQVLTGRAVRRISVRGGRASGVELDDGEVVAAAQFVASGVDPPQTMALAGEASFGAVAAEVRAYRWADTSLATLHLALTEPPAYAAASFDPDVSLAYGIYLGAESSAAIEGQFEAIRRGDLPEWFQGNGACNTLFDESQAPPGRHTAFWWPWAPYELGGSAPAWDDRRQEVATRILREWASYAPNLDVRTVLASHLLTPLDISRRCINMAHGSHHGGAYTGGQIDAGRPTPSLADYRTPVRALYLCGASSHPGGSIHGGPGYVAAGVIAGDLGVTAWWNPIRPPTGSG